MASSCHPGCHGPTEAANLTRPLRFFLNHRRFLRSRHAERRGKSPRELMTGHAHSHWLTLLGLGELQPRRV